jgi:hypothetical protein
MRAHDRRRLVLAAALTVAAVPALWILDRDDAADDGATTTVPAAGALPSTSAEPPVPVFLDNTTPVVPPAVIDIAVPDGPSSREARGNATFKRYIDIPVARPCTTKLAPTGVELTVTNIDNGLSTTCTNTRSVSVPPGADIAIDTQVYILIAELVEAPVPVRLTW